MKGTPAIYKGRIVSKEHFRTFIYNTEGKKKLVQSWDAYEAAMQTGIWFATLKDALASKAIPEVEAEVKPKPKSKAKSKAKPKVEKVDEVDDSANVLLDDGSVFEVTDGA